MSSHWLWPLGACMLCAGLADGQADLPRTAFPPTERAAIPRDLQQSVNKLPEVAGLRALAPAEDRRTEIPRHPDAARLISPLDTVGRAKLPANNGQVTTLRPLPMLARENAALARVKAGEKGTELPESAPAPALAPANDQRQVAPTPIGRADRWQVLPVRETPRK